MTLKAARNWRCREPGQKASARNAREQPPTFGVGHNTADFKTCPLNGAAVCSAKTGGAVRNGFGFTKEPPQRPPRANRSKTCRGGGAGGTTTPQACRSSATPTFGGDTAVETGPGPERRADGLHVRRGGLPQTAAGTLDSRHPKRVQESPPRQCCVQIASRLSPGKESGLGRQFSRFRTGGAEGRCWELARGGRRKRCVSCSKRCGSARRKLP